MTQECTGTIKVIFQYLKCKMPDYELRKIITNLLITLKARGLFTMLGMRQTVSSQVLVWPSLQTLQKGFNKPNIPLGPEEMMRYNNKNLPQLSVGARALCKHANRSSEGFWGEPRGTELQKNIHAKFYLNKILENCIWINIHSLPRDEYIIECRLEEGYGIRWTIDGTFRGFLEP